MTEKIYLMKEKGRSPYYKVIYFRSNGKRTSKSTGTTRKSEALKFLTEFKEHLKKKDIVPEIKLSKYNEQYKQFMSRGYSPRYVRSIDLSFRRLIEFTGDIYLSEVTRVMVEDFISITFYKTNHSARLFNRTLKAAFNKAVDNWGYIKENPFRKIKVPKIPEKLPVFITESQFKLILEETNLEILKDIFTLLFYTGMRVSEITHMTWMNIDFNKKQIIVRNTEVFVTKSKKERIIPMYKTVYEILKKREVYKRSDSYPVFFRILGIRLRTDYISRKFRRAVDSTKTVGKEVHLHTLRHSFASNLVRRNVSLTLVQTLLGHASVSTTEIYSHVNREDLVEAVNKFEIKEVFENG